MQLPNWKPATTIIMNKKPDGGMSWQHKQNVVSQTIDEVLKGFCEA